jgi:class 3 adenylate cyclase
MIRTQRPLAGEFIMDKSIQLRWIEQAEGRSVREHAELHRAVSEPHVNLEYAATGPSWFDRLRDLARIFPRAIGLRRSLPQDPTIRVKPLARTALGLSSPEIENDRVLVAVLITDIVESTRRVAELGDRDWRMLLDRHDEATRCQIKRFGGREVGNRGDGFVSIFDSPTRAVRCAAAIGDTIAPFGLIVRSGVHVGEVDLKSDEISGIAVHIAARIAAIARPGEPVVSKTVRDLVAGSGLAFEDRGVHQLRGLPEKIHLYAMRTVETPQASRVINLRTAARDDRTDGMPPETTGLTDPSRAAGPPAVVGDEPRAFSAGNRAALTPRISPSVEG